MDDIDALIGHGSQLPKAPPKRADTPQHEIDAIMKAVATGKGSFVDAGDLKRPVTQNFLALVFDMDPATVKKRLLAVKPIGYSGSGASARKMYDFKEACSYLVEPKIDLDAYIRSIDPGKLPNHLNKFYWDAQLAKQKFMERARELFAAPDILTVFGRVFMLIKDHVQLWPETAREKLSLSDEDTAKLKQLADALQNDLYARLTRLPDEQETPSYAETFDAVAEPTEDEVGA